MATKTISKSGITCSRSPKTGWFTLGKSSGGTNQTAQITFPALGIAGSIKSVKLYIPWDNDAADEGFSLTGPMVQTANGVSHNFSMSGMGGPTSTAIVDITSGGWSNASPFVVDLRGQSNAPFASSKGCSQNVYITAEYEPGTVRYAADGMWKQCQVFYGVNGGWQQVQPNYAADGQWKTLGG